MINYIYFEQNQWRWFACERLPVKPELVTDTYMPITEERTYNCKLAIYNSELSELKDKSLPVGNPEAISRIPSGGVNGVYEWPGEVLILDAPIARTLYGHNNQHKKMPLKGGVAILKLPETKEKDMKTDKWKQLEKISDLKPGDFIRGKSSGHIYIVTNDYGSRAIAVSIADVTNSPEWEVLQNNSQPQ